MHIYDNKLLQIYEKRIVMYAVYISQPNLTFNKRVIKPEPVLFYLKK
jgi:hypothetical protein